MDPVIVFVSGRHWQLATTTDLLLKSYNVPCPYPTMNNFVTEMWTRGHTSVTKWCIVRYLADALRDLWDGSISKCQLTVYGDFDRITFGGRFPNPIRRLIIRSRKISTRMMRVKLSDHIATTSERHGCRDAEKFQRDPTSIGPNLPSAMFCDIVQYDALLNIEATPF